MTGFYVLFGIAFAIVVVFLLKRNKRIEGIPFDERGVVRLLDASGKVLEEYTVTNIPYFSSHTGIMVHTRDGSSVTIELAGNMILEYYSDNPDPQQGADLYDLQLYERMIGKGIARQVLSFGYPLESFNRNDPEEMNLGSFYVWTTDGHRFAFFSGNDITVTIQQQKISQPASLAY